MAPSGERLGGKDAGLAESIVVSHVQNALYRWRKVRAL